MAIRYSADFLLHLRESPLCARPDNLPPAEEWMGAPPEQIRSQGTKVANDRPRTIDSPLIEQSNTDDIVLGPPRMAFSSARGNKTLENDKNSREPDSQGRIGLRGRGETDGDRFREGRPNPLRRRGDADPDNDGWNMVKPRKSFGAEGAERFHGKMGGNFRDDKRAAKDGNKDDRDITRDRPGPGRTFDVLARDREVPDTDGRTRTSLGRNRIDNWRASDGTDAPMPVPEKRDRDRTKSWRERDRNVEPPNERNIDKTNDRRWGREREQRPEREPEWLDEPADARGAHTQQDFQKWMDQMKKAKSGPSSSNAKPVTDAPVEPAKPSLPTPAVEGPDKFFLAFGGASGSTDVSTPSEQKDSTTKTKTGGKSSRFTSFFSQPQADSRSRTESSTPLTGPPANGSAAAAGSATVPPGLGALFGSVASVGGAQGAPPEEERQAFKQLLAKLQKASMSATPPGPSPFAAPPLANPSDGKKNALGSPEPPFQQFGSAPRDGSFGRPPSQQPHQEILAPRPQQQSARPEQLLQDLVNHHQRVSSQGSTNRPESNSARNNSNTEFLMNLMRMAPDAQRQDQGRGSSQPQLGSHMQKHSAMPLFNDREQEFAGRENRNNARPHPPPGFSMDESFHGAERQPRQNQPTQILQRPPPLGMDQMPPNWMTSGGQMPPPQQRGPMIAPPGLAGGLGGPNRNMPMPPMFPPNFPPGGMPPPDAMGGMPPRNMPLPPPGFFNGPPLHGFMPPGLGGFNGPPPGPEGFGGPPFEAQGMPPASGNGRGTNYGRP
ncbi:hypothetical protein QQS21_001170 [Conoideocrella luteorostrata]|uniref:Uncharacterized protein n=1 Tax=Conoideocrella luteorostrata TaxID=1105319 RepID=A0AAJ0G258_9HYPO|nr:hypothetical protein QQS21_001170 [Conoideocrella luteorostrata]